EANPMRDAPEINKESSSCKTTGGTANTCSSGVRARKRIIKWEKHSCDRGGNVDEEADHGTQRAVGGAGDRQGAGQGPVLQDFEPRHDRPSRRDGVGMSLRILPPTSRLTPGRPTAWPTSSTRFACWTARSPAPRDATRTLPAFTCKDPVPGGAI